MRTTTNYGFKLPENTDYINIDDINYNFEELDELIEGHDTEEGHFTVGSGQNEWIDLFSIQNREDTYGHENPEGAATVTFSITITPPGGHPQRLTGVTTTQWPVDYSQNKTIALPSGIISGCRILGNKYQNILQVRKGSGGATVGSEIVIKIQKLFLSEDVILTVPTLEQQTATGSLDITGLYEESLGDDSPVISGDLSAAVEWEARRFSRSYNKMYSTTEQSNEWIDILYITPVMDPRGITQPFSLMFGIHKGTMQTSGILTAEWDRPDKSVIYRGIKMISGYSENEERIVPGLRVRTGGKSLTVQAKKSDIGEDTWVYLSAAEIVRCPDVEIIIPQSETVDGITSTYSATDEPTAADIFATEESVRNAASRSVVYGSYTGDGEPDRKIVTGITPRLVLLRNRSTGNSTNTAISFKAGVYNPVWMEGGTVASDTRYALFFDDGFTFKAQGNPQQFNVEGTVYEYMAIGGTPA